MQLTGRARPCRLAAAIAARRRIRRRADAADAMQQPGFRSGCPAKPLMPARSICCSSGCWSSSLLVLLLLFFLLLRFAIHYRAGNADADRDHRIKKSWHWEVVVDRRDAGRFPRPVRLGRAALSRSAGRAEATRCRSTSSPSNGCGRCSTPAASARSTNCICRSAPRCGWSCRRRT